MGVAAADEERIVVPWLTRVTAATWALSAARDALAVSSTVTWAGGTAIRSSRWSLRSMRAFSRSSSSR